ncbi:MAG: glycosyltransferase family 4 protein [Sphingobacteriaceae bacterium]|nr:glycosyltransferase family 4 protein [Sphingobacteriaceae bacterium]
MTKKVTYIISDIQKAIAFEWIAQEINKNKIELSFILINNSNSPLEEFLQHHNIKTIRVAYRSKFDLLTAIFKCRRFLKKNKTDVVHAHLFDATFIGLMAAYISGIKTRIYTRHYATLNLEYFPHAVKWDKLYNKLATHIVAISENVKNVLIQKEGVPENKIYLIYHGFKLEHFLKTDKKKVASLQEKYNPGYKKPVIGVIARFIELKGIQFIIPAFKEVLIKYPNALLLLFGTEGDYELQVNRLLQEIPETSYKKVEFESEITSLYKIFDIYIHVPINENIEAFGQTYVECLASGIPLIATKSGIGKEILVDKHNSMVVPFQNTKSITEAIFTLLEQKEIRDKIISNSYATVTENFDLNAMIQKLETIYLF